MPIRKFSDAAEAEIVRTYRRIGTMKGTARVHRTTMDVVRACLKRAGIKPMQPRTIDSEKAELAIAMYESGEPLHVCGAAVGFTRSCIANLLRKRGIPMRDQSLACQTYSVKRDYFANIDSSAKAYLLGLFYADGCVHKDCFHIKLQERDRYLLEAAAREMGYTGSIRFYKGSTEKHQNLAYLTINDRVFCNHLRTQGVIDRKTSKLSFPFFLPENLHGPFLLGLSDGDGCLSFGFYRNGLQTVLKYAGSERMMLDLQGLFFSKIGAKGVFSRSKNKGCSLTFYSRGCLLAANYIYAIKPPLYMTRKLEKFRTIVELIKAPSPGHRSGKVLAEVKRAEFVLKQYAA